MGFWKKKKCLVTGVTGFVGSLLTKKLVEFGADVVGISRKTSTPDTLGGIKDKITIETGRIEDYEFVDSLFEMYPFDTCFHLAACSIVKFAEENPLAAFKTNITGTWNVLESSRKHRTTLRRLIVASSDKAYGETEIPYDETRSSLIGLHPYDCSKSCADLLAQTYFTTYDLPVRITRFCNIYGGGDSNDSRIIPGSIIRILRGEKPIVHLGRQDYIREYIYIDDVVEGYLLLAEKMTDNEDIKGRIRTPFAFCAYNISSGTRINTLNLVKKILRLMDKNDEDSEIDFQTTSLSFHEIEAQFLSTVKFREVFKEWKPKDLDEGLKITIEWYRDWHRKIFEEK